MFIFIKGAHGDQLTFGEVDCFLQQLYAITMLLIIMKLPFVTTAVATLNSLVQKDFFHYTILLFLCFLQNINYVIQKSKK